MLDHEKGAHEYNPAAKDDVEKSPKFTLLHEGHSNFLVVIGPLLTLDRHGNHCDLGFRHVDTGHSR
jgi:hypothetical protein